MISTRLRLPAMSAMPKVDGCSVAAGPGADLDPGGFARPAWTPARRAALGLLLAVISAFLAVEAAAESVFAVPQASAAARAWSRDRDLLWLLGQAAALGLPALLLVSGLGARLRTWLNRLMGGRRLLTASLFAGIYAALFVAVNLPVAALRQVRAEPFGLAAPGWAAWATAQLQTAWPLLAGALLLGWAPYWLFARSPRFWPVWAAGILIPLGAAALIAQPLGLDLQPLSDPKPREAISELAARAGAPEPRTALLQAEGADPCRGEMAAVKGLGPTKVLALSSNFLRTRPERQVRAAIAHELKHYTRNDDWKAFNALAALVVGGLTVLALGGNIALRFGSGRFGFNHLADPASLPLLALLSALFGLAGGAAFHRYGNYVEREADRFALELTQDNAATAGLMQHDLACMRLRNPETSWIQQTFRQNHPSIGARIAFAQAYRPWATGEEQRYAHSFRPSVTSGPL